MRLELEITLKNVRTCPVVTFNHQQFNMKPPRLKSILLTLIVLFVLFYLTGVVIHSQRDVQIFKTSNSPEAPLTIAIFGASGTAGDGILKAALASPNIGKIHVITRRTTPRIDEGVGSGKIELAIHMDYLDYSDVVNKMTGVDAVYWAIGINSLGADKKTYRMVHVDFPMKFVAAWTKINNKFNTSFHFISSSDISEDSTTMWIREKIRAENSLFTFAKKNSLRVIAYRPDYIGPTKERSRFDKDMLYWFFRPVGAAVRATQIGNAMIEVTIRGQEFQNGTKLSTKKIVALSDTYERRS